MKPRKSILRLLVLMFIVPSLLIGCGIADTLGQSRQTAMPTRIPLPEKGPAPVKGWEGATLETICLETAYSFPQIEGEVPQPIDESARLILTSLGMEVVDDASSCDATLTLNLSAHANAADYTGEGDCYNGGGVDGEVSLNGEGYMPLAFPVKGHEPMPIIIAHCNKDAVEYSFRNILFEALLDGLVQLWGPQSLVWALEIDGDARIAYGKLLDIGPVDEVVTALIYALEDKDRARGDALMMLGEFAPEAKEAIPFIIQLLNDDDDQDFNRGLAAFVLGRFGLEAKDAVPPLIQIIKNDPDWAIDGAEILKQTPGQDFGYDNDLYQQWWEENR